MHITLNTLTKKVIIHDLTLTRTDVIVQMLKAIGEDADKWQVVDKDDEEEPYTPGRIFYPQGLEDDPAAMS